MQPLHLRWPGTPVLDVALKCCTKCSDVPVAVSGSGLVGVEAGPQCTEGVDASGVDHETEMESCSVPKAMWICSGTFGTARTASSADDTSRVRRSGMARRGARSSLLMNGS